jgi:uncharacterized membrane protein
VNRHPIFILAVLAIMITLSEWLARRSPLRHLGSALLVIVLTALVSNLGVIPTYAEDISVYTGIFRYVGPLAIFLLLLQVHLRGLARAGGAMLSLFALGAVGTLIGVIVGMRVVGGREAFGDLSFALGGMFVGTYTGGSVNFNAVALQYGVMKNGLLYAGAAAVDNAATTVWMAVTVALPRILPARRDAASIPVEPELAGDIDGSIRPQDLSLLLGLGLASVWFSDQAEMWLARLGGTTVPSILILTTIALVLAQLEPVQRLRGTRVVGWLAVLLFLAVIGSLCDVAALREIGHLGRDLLALVSIAVLVHGLILFGVAQLLRVDPAMTAVASQANIGGSTSALALARSLGRGDLVLPAILIGALGNGLGTYLGFLAAVLLR